MDLTSAPLLAAAGTLGKVQPKALRSASFLRKVGAAGTREGGRTQCGPIG